MLDLSKCEGFKSHRSGWQFAIDSLVPLHSDKGILFDDFIEKTHSWHLHEYYKDKFKKIPYKTPWVGVWHIPHNCPEHYDYCHQPQSILDRPVFQESLKSCLGIFTLTDYLSDFIRQNVDVPVSTVKYPTEIPTKQWSEQKFLSNKKKYVIQLGSWLRETYAILDIRTRHLKAWFPGNYQFARYYQEMEKLRSKEWEYFDQKFNCQVWIPRTPLSDNDYDEYISSNIVFMKMYDTSANTAIVECIARNTPVVVNKLKGAIEYLGEEYPLLYDTIDEASSLINNNEKILEAHYYLKNMNKDWISGSFFRQSIQRKIKEWIM